MFPKADAWQEFRKDALSAIPQGSRSGARPSNSVAEFLRSGSYIVTLAQPKSIHLEVTSVEFGSALLGDAAVLLDHAVEHQHVVCTSVRDAAWESPAWLLVSAYYWGYFSALAITRLVGRTTTFLTAPALAGLSTLAPQPAPLQRPGAGAYSLRAEQVVSTDRREVVLGRSKDRLHEGTWKCMFGYLESKRAVGDTSSEPFETSLLSSMGEASRLLGSDWPSAVRNAVNYVPGFAYGQVRNEDVLGLRSFLRKVKKVGVTALLESFSNQLRSLPTRCGFAEAAVRTHPAELAKLTITLACLLQAVAWELYADIAARVDAVPSGNSERLKYLRRAGVLDGGRLWPYGDVR